LVVDERRGQWSFYELAQADSAFHQKLLETLQAAGSGQTRADDAALRALRRAGGCCPQHTVPESSSRWPSIFLKPDNPRSPRMPDPPSRAGWWAEALGTALLLATVVGSGIMGERLAGGNVAIALLANTLATGAGLVALILTLGPISGAHFNPAVTLADAALGGLRWRDVPGYVLAQVAGAFGGVAVATECSGRRCSRHPATRGPAARSS